MMMNTMVWVVLGDLRPGLALQAESPRRWSFELGPQRGGQGVPSIQVIKPLGQINHFRETEDGDQQGPSKSGSQERK